MAETKRKRRSKKTEEVSVEITTGEPIVTPIEEEAGEEIGTFSGLVVTKKDYLNVRKTPEGDKIGKLDRGTTHEFRDLNFGGWYELADGKGYVMAKFIKQV